ncbi:DGQHR domain-containing protein [bacterium]|nr:DGQHR domain-containing protein [bacterium]
MPKSTDHIVAACLEVEQPLGTFYVAVLEAVDAVFISKADIRRIEDDDIGRAVGIQRRVNPKRVQEIRAYVRTLDASFPTSIILSVGSSHVRMDKTRNELRIARLEDIAEVIDGQHRLKGLEGFDGTFQVTVTIFVDMDVQDKAMVFSTINLAQTKVNKSLVYDLYEFAKSRSPQKTCHDIAKLMNYEAGSPFFHSIKILGTASEEGLETITQSGFVEPILDMITRDALADRDRIQRREELERAAGREAKRLIFRNFFIDQNDGHIAKVIWNFFSAVERRWNDAWTTVERGNVINRSTGYRALARFMRDAYVHLGVEIPKTSDFLGLLDGIPLSDEDFTPDKFKPGSSGESELRRQLLSGADIPEYSR